MTGIGTARRHRARQLAVEPFARAVAIDRGQQNLARAALRRFARPVDGITRRSDRAAARVDREPVAHALGVDGDDHRLAAVARGEPRDERGIAQRRGVQADLVGARVDGRGRVVFGADAAADAERQEDLARDGTNGLSPRLPRLERGGDVEDDDLVDALAVVARGKRRRIAGVAQALEVDALDDLAVAHVETGDDAFRQHVSVVPSRTASQLSRMRRPTSPDFSGWNCTPAIRPRSTAAANGHPVSSSPPPPPRPTGATYECVKYTWAPGPTPRMTALSRGRSRLFQPTCGTLNGAGSDFAATVTRGPEMHAASGKQSEAGQAPAPRRCLRTATACPGRCRGATRPIARRRGSLARHIESIARVASKWPTPGTMIRARRQSRPA